MNLCPFNFDVLSQPILNYPFPQLSEITLRAKKLISTRSTEEINNAADIIDYMIEYYFDIEETKGIELSDEQYEKKINTRDTISDLSALQHSINWFDLNDQNFRNGKDFEFFAILALWLVSDSLDWLNLINGGTKYIPLRIYSLNNENFVIDSTQKIEQVRLAGIMCIDAMNSVCHAEMLATSDIIADEKSTRNLSLRGLKGSHEKNKKFIPLKELAHKLYQEKKWASPRQAAKSIYPKIHAHGKSIEINLSEDSGEDTVYRWLLQLEKELKQIRTVEVGMDWVKK